MPVCYYSILFWSMPPCTIWVNEDRAEPCVFLRSDESVRFLRESTGYPVVVEPKHTISDSRRGKIARQGQAAYT